MQLLIIQSTWILHQMQMVFVLQIMKQTLVRDGAINTTSWTHQTSLDSSILSTYYPWHVPHICLSFLRSTAPYVHHPSVPQMLEGSFRIYPGICWLRVGSSGSILILENPMCDQHTWGRHPPALPFLVIHYLTHFVVLPGDPNPELHTSLISSNDWVIANLDETLWQNEILLGREWFPPLPLRIN